MEHLNSLCSKVIQLSIDIHKDLGPGLLESVYKECLHYSLLKEGLYVQKECPVPLVYKEVKLECGFRLDLLIEKQLVVEIKSVENLSELHLAQTLTYLRVGGFKLGLLLNFNVPTLKGGIRRLIN